jgi:hypothetical protein
MMNVMERDVSVEIMRFSVVPTTTTIRKCDACTATNLTRVNCWMDPTIFCGGLTFSCLRCCDDVDSESVRLGSLAPRLAGPGRLCWRAMDTRILTKSSLLSSAAVFTR